MDIRPGFVNMALSPQEQAETLPTVANMETPIYPYGLGISLDDDCMEKLGVGTADFEVGDVVELRAMGRVTSVSSRETSEGACGRVEIQLTDIAVEDDQEAEAAKPHKVSYGKFYKK